MIKNNFRFSNLDFNVIVEIVPPSNGSLKVLFSKLSVLKYLPINAFNIATNPLTKSRMDALISSFLIQKYIEKPTIFHCTPRDQNVISLQGKLWGAKALNVNTVIAMTGDMSSPNSNNPIKVVQEINVFSLIKIARENGLYTGSVLGCINNNRETIKHFNKKVEAGTQFIVTQPVYSFKDVKIIKQITASSNIPIIMGIMPLKNIKHAKFVSEKLQGVSVPNKIMERMSSAKNQFSEGISIAREMLCLARENFNGVCIMPPLRNFDAVQKILN